MSKRKPYPAYKPSGVAWLGDIPAHWEVKRLKFICTEPLKYGANESAELIDPDLPRFIRITDINTDGTLRDDTFRSLPEKIAEPFLLRYGDLLFARSGATVGKTFLYCDSWGRSCYAGYLVRARLNPHKALPEFLSYFASSSAYWSWVSSIFIKATIQNVSGEKYANLSVPVPPLEEQRAIAAYLDRETARIDALVAKNERLIELLQEKRTALISHAVTRGLDANAPLKDSGVAWLGKVPKHWEVKRLKYVARFLYGDSLAADAREDGEFAVFGSNGQVGTHTQANTLEPALIIGRKGSFGKINYSAQPCFAIDTTFYIDKRSSKNDLRWLFYTLSLLGLDRISQDSAVPGLSRESAYEKWLPVPPLPEQRAIAAYLDRETAKIDALVSKVRQVIEKLQEYRTALISAAVTGKIDVRDL